MITRFVSAALLLSISGLSAQAATATLQSLLGGGTLVEGDVIFDNFAFQDNSDIASFPDDTEIAPAEVTLSTSATATSVSLTATFDPSINLVDDTGYFDFFLDYTFSISGSSRTLSSVDLSGDLFATGQDADAEIVYELGGFTPTSPVLEIFADTQFGYQLTDSAVPLGSDVTSLLMESRNEGETMVFGDNSGLSYFTVTFNLAGTVTPPPPPPEPDPIPLPAGLPLLLAGLGSLAVLRRRKARG